MTETSFRVPSSPDNSTAPTAKGQFVSPQLLNGGPMHKKNVALSEQRQGSSFNAAVFSPAMQSSFLVPGDGVEGLELPQSPRGPSSACPTQTMNAADTFVGGDASDDVVAGASDSTRDGAAGDLSHTHSAETNASVRERALRAKEAEVLRLRRTVGELSVQLNNALRHLDARADATAELQAMKSAIAAEAERRDDAVRSIRLEMLESRVKYRSMEEELASKYDGDVQTKATELLAAHTKEVHDENFELLKEKLLLAQEVEGCRAEYKKLLDSYNKLRRETDLDSAAKKQLLERSVVQKKQIAALRQQVKTCEDNLDAVVREYDRRLKEQDRQHQAVVDTLTRERDDARRDSLLLKRELNQLRNSAANVLSQRSDMDDFFYAALSEVRQRVVEERRQQLSIGAVQPESTAQDTRVAAAASPSYSPAQTTTSLLRLETTGRLLITGGGPGASQTTSANGRWTLDCKGFPKRGAGAAAGTSSAQMAKDNGSFSHSPLPPVATTPRGPRSAPPAAQLDGTGTLISIPNSLPAYLRADVADYILGAHSSNCDGRPAPRGPPPPQAAVASSRMAAPQDPHLPLLHRLPNPVTWKDLKDVDVASLSWADKERVIQLMFNRMQGERRRRGGVNAEATTASRSNAEIGTRKNTAAPEGANMPHFKQDADSSTFLTQS